ncbi:class I adenylate-forming enzyme family protein [Streptomyces sp. NPDC093600]|uniref:class I adenylate-forming enzyme family protein n=1 Tax=Streptomyces sp. NPDC093600 TaxID=3366047 RepID=UPI003801DBF7
MSRLSSDPEPAAFPLVATDGVPHLRGRRRGGPCVRDDRYELDDAGFAGAVMRVASRLADRGVERGDVVAVALPNRVEALLCLFACWHIGAIVTPVNPRLTAEELVHQLDDSGARLTVVDACAGPLLRSLGRLVMESDELCDGGPDTVTPAVLPAGGTRPGELALLVYTSGTTGRSKGVELTHGNITAMIGALAAVLKLPPGERGLVVLPLFHVNALMTCVFTLHAGGDLVLVEGFRPAGFWPLVERHRPAYFSAVPTIYHLLTALPPSERPDVSSLRFVLCGAAPMPAAAVAAFESRYGVPVVEAYGLTESTVALTMNPPDGVRKPGTVGPPLPGVELLVLGEDSRPLPTGAAGEVVARGPMIMRGYHGRPQETVAALTDGWLHTGDVGHLDEDGYLTLVDRKKDLVIRGGENIAPSEVEAVLQQHPAVLEAAVVGRSDPVHGEVPVAWVTARAEATVTPEELRDFTASRLARFKVPQHITITCALPRNAVGKLDKQALRTMPAEPQLPDPQDTRRNDNQPAEGHR